jgi:hypothetical protein
MASHAPPRPRQSSCCVTGGGRGRGGGVAGEQVEEAEVSSPARVEGSRVEREYGGKGAPIPSSYFPCCFLESAGDGYSVFYHPSFACGVG